MEMTSEGFDGNVDDRLGAIFMFLFSIPFACVPLLMAVLCYWTLESYYYGWIDFSGLIFQLGLLLLFMITFGVVGFGLMIASFKVIIGGDSMAVEEENIDRLNETRKPIISLKENSNNAVRWRLTYYVERPYRVLKIRDTINLAAYNLQEEFGIDLSTPQLESSVKK